MTEYALDAADRFPNKRLLVHYLQPHYPFIDADTEFDKNHIDDPGNDRLNVWNRKMNGELAITRDQLWELYVESFERALPHIKAFCAGVEGRTVVSSDHGNMVGERSFPFPIREWGHPRGIYTTPLVKVPWLVQEADDRKPVRAEAPAPDDRAVRDSAIDDVVNQRPEDLGYV